MHNNFSNLNIYIIFLLLWFPLSLKSIPPTVDINELALQVGLPFDNRDNAFKIDNENEVGCTVGRAYFCCPITHFKDQIVWLWNISDGFKVIFRESQTLKPTSHVPSMFQFSPAYINNNNVIACSFMNWSTILWDTEYYQRLWWSPIDGVHADIPVPFREEICALNDHNYVLVNISEKHAYFLNLYDQSDTHIVDIESEIKQEATAWAVSYLKKKFPNTAEKNFVYVVKYKTLNYYKMDNNFNVYGKVFVKMKLYRKINSSPAKDPADYFKIKYSFTFSETNSLIIDSLNIENIREMHFLYY